MIKRANSVEELTDTQLYCHLYRHDFDEPEVYLEHSLHWKRYKKDTWVMIHKCNCGTIRHDYVEPETYVLWDRKYSYFNTDGYLISFVATMEDYRREVIRRRRIRKVEGETA